MDAATISALHALVKDDSMKASVRAAAEANLLKVLTGNANEAGSDGGDVPTPTLKKMPFGFALMHANPEHNFLDGMNTTGGTKGQVALISKTQSAEVRRILGAAIAGDEDAVEMARRALILMDASKTRRVDKSALKDQPVDYDNGREVTTEELQAQLAKIDKSRAESARRKEKKEPSAGAEAPEKKRPRRDS